MKHINKNLKHKVAVFSQILSLVIEIFAFSFIIGGMTFGITVMAVPEVSATSIGQTGCCTETTNGEICQELNLFNKELCKTNILTTSCDTIDKCEKGCCFDTQKGLCSLNAPREKCEQSGGNWSNNANCQIQECQLGCCILGDNAEQTTSLECAKMSRDLKLNKNFQTLDSDGTCNTKTGLNKKGACVLPVNDFSGENSCKITLKENCQSSAGSFYENLLCTAKELNTNCEKTKNTTCVEDKDQVYYIDTCGNPANIYDASKYDNDSYWETSIPASESCSTLSGDSSCGNCDYTSGSVCAAYRKDKDTKPVIGNNVCRNLNCLNGRKHGESWCINDYPFSGDNILPVGSRYFRGICLDGEISIEPCADFGQEICLEQSSSEFTNARCVMNNWRSCLAANNEPSFEAIKSKCEINSQCMMFNDYYAGTSLENVSENNSSKLSRSDGQILAGFNPSLTAEEQGASGKIGQGSNGIISHCVPKYAPGFVFWKEADKNQTVNYGGSYTESKYICSLGSFTCVSKEQRSCKLSETASCAATLGLKALVASPDCKSWQDVDNWECNVDGANKEVNKTELPKLMAALNERCRAIGSCGINSNIAGEKVTTNSDGFVIKRVKIDVTGKPKNASTTDYILSQGYLDSLPGSIEKISSLSDLIKKEALELAGLRSKATSENPKSNDTTGFDSAQTSVKDQVKNEMLISNAENSKTVSDIGMYGGGLGLVFLGIDFFGGGAAALTYGGAGVAGFNVAGGAATGAAIGAMAGQIIGKMIVKKQNWSPGHVNEFMDAMIAIGTAIGATVGFALALGVTQGFEIAVSACAAGPIGCIIGAIIVILTLVYYFYESCIDNNYTENEYYIMQFNCGTWQAPSGGSSCELCNNDVRPCSEYRCKSLGENCQYSNANGEPGICSNFVDWTSATISPSNEGLSEGLKYNNIKDTSFSIEKNSSIEVDAYTAVEFGIKTDKLAQCRIDNKHTTSFDQMAVAMNTETSNCETGNCQTQGNNHIVALSPYIPESESGSATLGLKQGENQFYIRCKTSSGGINQAEFVVKVITGAGPDRTPPNIEKINPISGSYLKRETNYSGITVYVNEPSECKYSTKKEDLFEQMNSSLICMTDSASSILGQWPCYSTLENLSSGENKIYIQCKDHPELAGRSESTRNLNKNSKEYSLSVCSTGLNITQISPAEPIITGKSPISATVEVKTSGCIDGGKSICNYRLDGMSEGISFLKTNSQEHSQTFTSLPNGLHNLTVTCIDEAGNSDNKTITMDVNLDDQAPTVVKSYYEDNRKLVVITNENAICRYATNSSLGCFFNFDSDNSTLMTGEQTYHEGYWRYTENYYVKCQDKYNNTNLNCGVELRTY